MAGIYIHIPFCKQACHYCNFHFSTSLKLQNDFLDALLKEIDLREEYIARETVNTIYFGGGTPSLLPVASLAHILDALHRRFDVSPTAEVTLEANPDDIDPVRPGEWKKAGINRLSVGIQSFFDEDLSWMNRAHGAAQARACIPLAQDAGFDNISADLIYGIPGLTDDGWLYNLNQMSRWRVPHLSCYALTVEDKTSLDAMIRKKSKANVSQEDQARQFLLMTDFLGAEGYEHYEISNFAIPGKRSAHNSSYWKGEKYLGLGPSAHSFNGNSRQWNVSNNALYIQSLRNNELSFETEALTKSQQLNEYVMTSLRTVEGTDMRYIGQRFGEDQANRVKQDAREFIQRGWLTDNNCRLILTRIGRLYADGIAAQLFVMP